MENNQMRQNRLKVVRILAEHGYRLVCSEPRYDVYSSYATQPNKFLSLISVVDYYKPIIQDAELTAMYN